MSGSITGTIVDPQGHPIQAAAVVLTSGAADGPGNAAAKQLTSTDTAGRFVFFGVAAGPFLLSIDSPGFTAQTRPGTLQAGAALQLDDITLPVAIATSQVLVSKTEEELAEEQIEVEEKQHIFGVIPNFYVAYDPNTLALSPRQKYELAWKTAFDPFTFIGTGISAGIQQANDTFSGYGQGAQGYAKRYAAAYADGFIGNFLGSALLPALLKQDPRYYYKGTGSKWSRVRYALAFTVLCKGDNGHWQFNYSGTLGDLAGAGISNLYYPPADRNGAGLTFENFAIGLGGGAFGNIMQEFVVKHLTPHTRSNPAQP